MKPSATETLHSLRRGATYALSNIDPKVLQTADSFARYTDVNSSVSLTAAAPRLVGTSFKGKSRKKGRASVRTEKNESYSADAFQRLFGDRIARTRMTVQSEDMPLEYRMV